MTMSTFTSTNTRINDLRRVEESLAMIAPRWSVRILHTLDQDTPLRFTEVKQRLPQMQDPSLSQRLAALADHGLVDRTASGRRPVYYELTERGRDLAPVHDALAAWATACLEHTGPATEAEHAEDALRLVSPRHATTVLWALQQNGPMRSGELSREVTPGMSPMVMTSRLRQLGADGLVERVTDGHRSPYRLTPAAHALGPVYTALSAWAAGRPTTSTHHPVWAPTHTSQQRSSTPASREREQRQEQRSVAAAATATSSRTPAFSNVTSMPLRTAPGISAQRFAPAWRKVDLFSHSTRTLPTNQALVASGRSR
ncbi:winged helix-turn-helix transcriptional regulator [Streptomyces sp. NPDC053048]|uniref:winged helix-turn-helix transcriptional regulator n=1 Tax=Streptomyces sp. NPDC053048 TaxID=3365694 RepID=UPI0037D2ABA5